MDDRADRDASARRPGIADSQGVQVGDHNIQVPGEGALAAAYRAIGRADEAIEQCGLALGGLEAAWGPDDGTAIRLRDHLAIIRREAAGRGSAPPD